MFEKTTARVVVGEGASDEFKVNIGLRQGSVVRPLLFIAVLDLISRKTAMKDAMKKLLYAHDIICRGGEWQTGSRHWMSGPGCLPDTG